MINTNDISFKINMLSILIDHLRELKNNNDYQKEIHIFFMPHKSVIKLPSLWNEEEVVSIVLGGDYEFKKLQILDDGLSVYLADHRGNFQEFHVLYEFIVGFTNGEMYLKSKEIVPNIQLHQITEIKRNLSESINLQIQKIFENLEENDFEKNQT